MPESRSGARKRGVAGVASHAERNTAVTGLDVHTRALVLDGQPFGATGAYEKIAGTIRFAADPAHPLHRSITDIGLAPRNAAGRVEFSGRTDTDMTWPVLRTTI